MSIIISLIFSVVLAIITILCFYIYSDNKKKFFLYMGFIFNNLTVIFLSSFFYILLFQPRITIVVGVG